MMKLVVLVGALLLASAPAHAMTYYLTDQWLTSGGNRMCQ